MRYLELTFLAFPLLAYVLWLTRWRHRGPPRFLVLALVGMVMVMGGLLLILRMEDAAPRDSAYIPSRIEDGRIIRGHAEPASSPSRRP